MKLTKPTVPKELDADVAMAVIIQHMDLTADQKPCYSYEFKGVSERTALGDNLDVTVRNRQNTAPSVKFSLKRDSLYHILPEFLFHPLQVQSQQMGHVELSVLLMQVMMNRILRAAPLRQI